MSNGNRIFTNKNYSIYLSNRPSKYKYIVYNRNKNFKDAHTHVETFMLAKILIYCCLTGDMPRKFQRLKKDYRFTESLVRVCTNKYKREFTELFETVKNTKNRDVTI